MASCYISHSRCKGGEGRVATKEKGLKDKSSSLGVNINAFYANYLILS